MTDWGMKLSQPGYDVSTTDNTKLIFNSEKPPVKLLFSGTLTVTIDSASTSGATTLALPYDGTHAATPSATAVLNGKRYLSNVFSEFGTITSPTDYHAFRAALGFPIPISGVNVWPATFTVSRNNGGTSSTSGTTENFTIRYFIIGFTFTDP